MKRSRFVAVMAAFVMVMGVIQPAFAWYGGKVVVEHCRKLTESIKRNRLSQQH